MAVPQRRHLALLERSALDPSSLLPMVTVMGRSVLGRNVRQGTRRKVLSSWIPPLSVRMKPQVATSFWKAK